MIRGTLRQRFVALIAAYAVALQGLFVAAGPATASAPFELLCSELARGSTLPADTAGHDAACKAACTMLAGTPGPVPSNSSFKAPLASAPSVWSWRQANPPAARKGAHTARAPPLV